MNSIRYVSVCLLLVWCACSLTAQRTRKATQTVDTPALFRLLGPEHTNITFNNELEDTRDHSILIYSNYYGGGGVGVGDINNDGLSDIYFAGNLVGDKLYLNKGNMVFEDITQQAGVVDNGGWSSGVLFADVNGDGYQDIYVTRELYDREPALRRNVFYVNNGDNTFTESAEKYGIADEERTRHATFLDYDNDGDLDLFLLNQPPNPGDYSEFYNTELLQEKYRPRLLENQGEVFKDVTVQAGFLKTGFPNSVSASDFNGDGWTDLYVANDFWVGDWLYINNGDGTFSDTIHESMRHISFSSMGVDAGDINNDGLLDLMVVDMAAEEHYRNRMHMAGMNPEKFNQVVKDSGHHQYFTNTLQLNQGNNQYSDIAQLAGMASTDWSWSGFFADLDNDGWKDLFIANGLMRDIRNNDGAINFRNYVESALHQYILKNPNPAGDVSIWNVIEMQEAMNISPSVKVPNYAFKNNGDLTFSKRTNQWGLDLPSFSNGAAYADLDNDGDLDLVINNINDFAFVYENMASQILPNHFLRVKLHAEKGKMSPLGVKIWARTASGTQFFETTGVRGMYSTSEPLAHFGLGDDNQVEELRVRWPDGRENVFNDLKSDQTVVVDYNHSMAVNPDKDVVMGTTLTEVKDVINYKHRENVFDDYRTQVLLPYKMSGFGPCLTTGDINGDGLEDIFAGGAIGQEGQFFLQDQTGAFTLYIDEAIAADKRREDNGATLTDVDNDGDLDLYVVNGGNEYRPGAAGYQDRLYLNDGKGKFNLSKDIIPDIDFSGSVVEAEDFDQDGDMDLFVGGRHSTWSYPAPASSMLLINEGGRFVNGNKKAAPVLDDIGMVNDATWADFDGDGLSDLVLVGEWMSITFLKNTGDAFVDVTTETGIAHQTGWWFSVEKADLDGDGDLDFVAGNLGLNHTYKATGERPFEVYYDDFDNNGRNDIVLTYFEGNKKLPYRRRECSIDQVPALADKFPDFHSFAQSDVFDVY
ncbi:MAG: VCBS repeat-containing protein, partial [Cyclobacteriaceae bacterium]|nr:VCBS repeat-containing protein [Cyclobacteriaceae bacterium]